VLVPLLLHRIVRGTALGFLFERPAWAKLSGTTRKTAMVPAE